MVGEGVLVASLWLWDREMAQKVGEANAFCTFCSEWSSWKTGMVLGESFGQ